MEKECQLDYMELYKVLSRYASKKWSGLKTPVEDLVQQTLIDCWNREDKIKNLPWWDSHCCRSLDIIAHNTLLEEHKKGLWIQQSANAAKDRNGDEYDLYERNNNELVYIHDPWLDEFREKERKRKRQYYYDHREEILEKHKEYYKEHREEQLAYQKAYQKQYRKDNIEKLRELQKDYHQRNKEKYREYSKRYYQEHIEQSKRYYQEHKEKYKAYMEKYSEQNKEKIAEYSRKRWQKVKDLQQEIIEQYGVLIDVDKISKLLTAKMKSEEQYKKLLGEYLLEKKG